jgi:hypothetical protein
MSNAAKRHAIRVRGNGPSRDHRSWTETPHPDFPLTREIRPLPQGERREYAASAPSCVFQRSLQAFVSRFSRLLRFASPLAGEAGWHAAKRNAIRVRGNGPSRDYASRTETPHPDFPRAREIRPLPQGERREYAASAPSCVLGDSLPRSFSSAFSTESLVVSAMAVRSPFSRSGSPFLPTPALSL